MRLDTLPRNRNPAHFDRRFYLATSVVFLALVFWTFARTYYLSAFFNAPPLSLLRHVHGAVMSGWVVLVAAQSGLITAHRVRWHRWLGTFGAAWAALVVILGSTMTSHAAADAVRAHSAQAPVKIMIMGLELLQMLLFAGFVSAAIWLRRRTDYHKRFMLLTLACMLPSVLARLPVSFMSNVAILLGINLIVLACVGIDTWRNRRLHPAFAWGATLLLATINLMFYVAQTPVWIAFGRRLVT